MIDLEDSLKLVGTKEEMVSSKRNKSQRGNQEVFVDWKPIKEVTPTWRRLWQLLLSPSLEPKNKEGSEESQNR